MSCIIEKDCALKKAMNNPADCSCTVRLMFDGMRWQGQMAGIAIGAAKKMVYTIMHPELDRKGTFKETV